MLEIQLHLSAFPQSDRMRFLAQEMVIKNLEPVKSRADTADDPSITVSVLDAAYREARDGPMLLTNRVVRFDQHLEATVTTATETWRKYRASASGQLQRILDQALAKMHSDLPAHRCEDCERDGLCAGILLPDQERDALEPVCLKSLYELAKAGAEFTRHLYAKCLSGLTGRVEIDFHFASEPRAAERATGLTKYTQSGARLALPGAGSSSWVSIGLPIWKLDPDKYFPVIYVIAHELAVHAVQELLRVEPRAHPKERVAFAEGLIDRVIYEELVQAIRDEGIFNPPIPTDALDPIDTFHATRRHTPEAQETFWAIDVGHGRRAYEALLKLGRHALRVSAATTDASEIARQARDWAHASALALNVMALSEGERQDIVEALAGLDDQYFGKAGKARAADSSETSALTQFAGALAEIQQNVGPEAREQLFKAMETL
jgi:hypothetical protein